MQYYSYYVTALNVSSIEKSFITFMFHKGFLLLSPLHFMENLTVLT